MHCPPETKGNATRVSFILHGKKLHLVVFHLGTTNQLPHILVLQDKSLGFLKKKHRKFTTASQRAYNGWQIKLVHILPKEG